MLQPLELFIGSRLSSFGHFWLLRGLKRLKEDLKLVWFKLKNVTSIMLLYALSL